MVSDTGMVNGDAMEAAAAFGRAVAALDDEALGDAIDTHGREAVEHEVPVSLGFYLAAVADLAARPVPLDAAIDVALRWLVHVGHSAAEARDRLLGSHPGLARAIQEAAVLGKAVVATSDLRRRIEAGNVRPLPCEFGPRQSADQCRFQLVEFLGAGAGGHVYRAVDRTLSDRGFNALVAVKVFKVAGSSTWLRERFVEEASKARRVQHRNVVRVLDRDVSENGEDFIVYEYVDGGTLERWLATETRTLGDRVRVAAGIARGVQAAHSSGVVHCDLKPSNVLVTADGEPRVADFGVAVRREAWAENVDVTATDRPVGNLAFISPEQYRMEHGALSPISDVYAVGGILYWLITASLPNGGTLAEIERRHSAREAVPAPSGAGIDKDLVAICGRALRQDPAERYQSAGQMADDLESWLALEPIRWTRPSTARVAKLWARRRPGLAGSLVALVSVALAAAWITVSLRTSAAHSRAAAAAAGERIRIREEERRAASAEVKQRLGGMMQVMNSARPWEALPLAPYFDWVLGTSVFGDPGDNRPVWTDRIGIIQGMLDTARATQGDNGFETLSLEMTLGFWLLVDRKPSDAAPILAHNRAGWRAVVPGDSAVHEWGDILRMVAEAELSGSSGETAALRDQLTRLMPGTPGPTHTPLRKLVERTLRDLRPTK